MAPGFRLPPALAGPDLEGPEADSVLDVRRLPFLRHVHLGPGLLLAMGLGTLAIDMQVDRGVASGVLYVGAVALTAGLPGRRITLAAAALATLLTEVGYVLSPGVVAWWKGGANSLLAVLAVWVTAALVLHHKRLVVSLEQAVGRAARSERQFSAAFEAVPVGLLLLGADGRIALVNSAAARLFAYTRKELQGRPLDMLLPAAAQRVRAVAEAPDTAGRADAGDALDGLDKQGRALRVDLGLNRVDTPQGEFVLATVVDLADRELIEQVQGARALTRRVIEAEESQRKRMAREIHDALGQPLTALKLDLGWLARRLAGVHPDLQARTLEMEGLAATTIDEVRRLSAELRPAILDEQGLPAAMRWQVEDFEKRAHVRCTLSLHDDVEWDADGCTVAYRVLQESLTNVARHAGASRVGVSLHRDAEGLGVLEISDDGRGFDAAAAHRPGALGLMGMHERASLQGGSLDVQRGPGTGSTVRLRLPCAPAGAA